MFLVLCLLHSMGCLLLFGIWEFNNSLDGCAAVHEWNKPQYEQQKARWGQSALAIGRQKNVFILF